MYSAVIFDLDGTLIDSEWNFFDAFFEACEKYGKVYTKELHAYQLGIATPACAAHIVDVLELPVSPKEFIAEFEVIRKRIFSARSIVPRDGARELVVALHESGIKLGVATASGQEYRDAALEAIGIKQYFSSFVSADQVQHGKPAPDIYLKVAELLGVEPSNALAVEDGPAGVESAKSAGMDVLGICDGRFTDSLEGTKRTVSTFIGVTLKDIEALYVR
ncbi:MAG: HAD family phosphatase [Patescibacteria group bacterium]